MGNAKLVTLSNLPDSFYVDLDIKFREHLFNRARKNRTWGELSKQLEYTRDRLFCLRRGFRIVNSKKEKNMLNMKLVRILCHISKIDIEKIERHVIAIKSGCRGEPLPIKLPIHISEELASIVAHAMGDGHLRDRTFVYFNESLEVINKLKDDINKVFGTEIVPKEYQEDGGIRLVYSAIVSRITYLVGGVRYNKVEQNFDVPNWIREGSIEIKSSFLRAIFDDEAHVNVDNKYITFQMASTNRPNYLFDSLRNMLNEFGIASKVGCAGEYRNKKGEVRKMFSITFGRFESVINYKKHVGFENIEKQIRLENIIDGYDKAKYIKYENPTNIVFNAICDKQESTITSLMKELNMSYPRTAKYLNQLHKDGRINKIGKSPAIWKAVK